MTLTSSTSNEIGQHLALDVQGFDAMRAMAKSSPQAGMKAVAQQFDAIFTQMMLKSMRDATPSDGIFDSNASAMYTSMLDGQLAQQMSTRGIGVADLMLNQLPHGSAKPGGALDAGGSAAMNALAKAYGNTGTMAASEPLTMATAMQGATRPPLAATSGGSPTQAAFVDKLAEPAQAASAATGVPAHFILGQAGLESGWGKHEILNADGTTSHNIFGIKAGKGWSGKTVSALTTEYVNGQPQQVVGKFRAYGSYEEAMTDYAHFLKSNPRYANVLKSSSDPVSFANGMQQAGYATDPRYAQKLLSAMARAQPAIDAVVARKPQVNLGSGAVST